MATAHQPLRTLLLAALLLLSPPLLIADDGLRAAIRHLSVNAYIGESGEGSATTLYQFYRGRRFHPLWLVTGKPGEAAVSLLAALKGAREEGLERNDYPIQRLETLLGASDKLSLGELELRLSESYLHYAGDLATGRLKPHQVDPDWHISPERLPLLEWMTQDLQKGRMAEGLADLAPYRNGYRRLKRALQEHRTIAASGGWPVITAGATLRQGMDGARVAALRRRLAISGDLPKSAAEVKGPFDGHLTRAVKRFQRRHGLAADGRVGPRSLAALNVPVESRLRQITISMERWRWLPHRPDPRYLLVNMAGYELYAIDTSQREMTQRIIIGKAYRQTPVFSAEMTSLVVNPYWYVPTTILNKDILPRLQRDPTYLQRARLKVFSDLKGHGTEVAAESIDWQQYSGGNFPYTLRQDPGGRNALGRLKFMMDNPYGIYLHDTPNRSLFARSERAFSSGCIRVEDPEALAAFVLNDEPPELTTVVADALMGETPRRISLESPLPVYLVYWTAWVDDQGLVNFRDDVYGRDWLLQQALQQRDGRGRLTALSTGEDKL